VKVSPETLVGSGVVPAVVVIIGPIVVVVVTVLVVVAVVAVVLGAQADSMCRAPVRAFPFGFSAYSAR